MRRHTRFLVALTSLGCALSALTATSTPAEAVISGNVLSGTDSPMWQTNNEVDAVVVSNGVVYAGGRFTAVRPPGAASGSNQTTRRYLAAFNATTGALVTSFNVPLDGRVRDLAVSPDGTKLYVAGSFNTVDNVQRRRLAAVNLPSGTVDTGFRADAGASVTAVEATSDTVYLGGDFGRVNGVTRGRFAAVDARTGDLDPDFAPTLSPGEPSFWTPNPGSRTYAIKVPADGSRVLIGGSFARVDGVLTGGIASLDPQDGSLQPWAASTVQPINTNCTGRVTDIALDADNAYVTGEGDPPGCYEGVYAARLGDGQLLWNSPCLGASQGIAVLDGVVYKGSHQHDCAYSAGGAFGGYVGGTDRGSFRHKNLEAHDVRDGSFVHWSPDVTSGGTTQVGPHALAAGPNQLVVAGDFTRINGSPQQGLARFVQGGDTATPERPGVSYNGDPWPDVVPHLVARLPVTVQPTAANTLTIEVPAVHDADTGMLTYRFYRDNQNTPIATLQAESYPWSRPVLRYDDTGLAPGSTHSYRVQASDGSNTGPMSAAVSGTVRTSAPRSFADQQAELDPRLWWRLNDSGTTAADSATGSGGSSGSLRGGVSTGRAGALASDDAVTLDGSTGFVSSQQRISVPNAFTQSAWFKTDSIHGGVIMAQSPSPDATGSGVDRILTLDNNGNIVFAMKAGPSSFFGVGTINIRNQEVVWNDGKWHQVVGTYDGDRNAALYVDGWLQGTATGTPFDENQGADGLASGFVHAGYADMSSMQLVFGINYYDNRWPISDHFDGSLDEVSVYDRALSAAEVAELFAAGVADVSSGPPASNQAPDAAFSVDHTDLTGIFDATASSDPDGSVVDWAWTYGDGATGSGETSSHEYAAAGTYQVGLTVTDDDGATATVSHPVTVTDPGAPTGDPVDSVAVARGSQWSWRFDNGAPPADWNQNGFDASGWNAGDAVLGWGHGSVDTDISTAFANPTDRPRAAYFTRTFDVPDASKVTRLVLDTVANDGVVVYVNGVEVTRHNMRAGAVTYLTYAPSARNTNTANNDPVVVDVPTSLLVDGTNVVSAETHVNYRRTRDVTFDLLATLTTLE